MEQQHNEIPGIFDFGSLNTGFPFIGLALKRSLERGFIHSGMFKLKSEKPLPEAFPSVQLVSTSIDENAETAFFESPEASVVLHKEGTGVTGWLYANSKEQRGELIQSFNDSFPPLVVEDTNAIPVNFWSLGSDGPSSTGRRIETLPWAEIKDNYASEARAGIEVILPMANFSAGQLILLRGVPGSGKTHSIRALINEWRRKCQIHYIVDADAFFGSASYMLSVVMGARNIRDVGEEPLWNLIILEDAGELITADAKQQTGQGLARLLNLVDGMIGQGLKVLLLITTNEELGKLHPAISRPGRCSSNIEFIDLPVEQANEWLKAHSSKERVSRPTSLAVLYATLRGDESLKSAKKPVSAGFGRSAVSALLESPPREQKPVGV